MKLINQRTNQVVIEDLQEAKTIWSRSKGLLGRNQIGVSEGLWIHSCNSIHTCFMRFAIDAVFLDRTLRVKAIHQNMNPWRLHWPVWSASSVIELAAGTCVRKDIQVGDQLHVGV